MKKTEKTIWLPEYERLISHIVELRHKRGLTQRKLADRLNVHCSYIGKIESRERRMDAIEFMSIMDVLGASDKEILTVLKDIRKK